MALTSATPQQPTASPLSPEDPDVGNGIKVPQTPIPGNTPTDPTQAAATMKSGASMTQAMNNVASKSGKSSGGGLFGSIGSVIGKAIPFIGGLFQQGGYVDTNTGVAAKGLAEGGINSDGTYGSGQSIEPGPASPPQDPKLHEAYGMGYAVGALHQRDFGGTPDTLQEAAAIIGKMVGGNGDMGQQQGFAGGGMSTMQPMPANPAMMPPQPQQSMPQPMLPPAQPNHPIARGYMGQQRQPMQPMQQPGQPSGGQPPTGYFPPHMAMGGPPPLQPGQPFVGEGEVKGPGGPTDDAIPAKLSNGEFVMSAPATAFLGVEKLVKLNEQGKQGFMQAQGQVEANQGAPPGAPPGAGAAPPSAPPGMGMPPGMPPQQPPMMQAKGGPAVTRTRNSGFMG